ncbi:hypothetical protein GF351_02095 [Candidatus Woesearchaeota archaeon]|nr:hypothetical protein [Candidatus Woesearchaeota archaeon]
MPPKTKTVKTKVKKKRWIKIVAPKSFNQELLGETYVLEPKQVLGRHISVNLMSLTRDPKKQNTDLTFYANQLSGEEVMTEIAGYRLSPSTIKRMVRRGKDRIDHSFVAVTSDKKRIRIKPLMITLSCTHRPARAALKKGLEKAMKSAVSKNTFEKLIHDIITFRFQRTMKDAVKKIYPLRTVEIRSASIEKEKTFGEEEKPDFKIEKKPEGDKEKKEAADKEKEIASEEEKGPEQEREPKKEKKTGEKAEEQGPEKPKKAEKQPEEK